MKGLTVQQQQQLDNLNAAADAAFSKFQALETEQAKVEAFRLAVQSAACTDILASGRDNVKYIENLKEAFKVLPFNDAALEAFKTVSQQTIKDKVGGGGYAVSAFISSYRSTFPCNPGTYIQPAVIDWRLAYDKAVKKYVAEAKSVYDTKLAEVKEYQKYLSAIIAEQQSSAANLASQQAALQGALNQQEVIETSKKYAPYVGGGLLLFAVLWILSKLS